LSAREALNLFFKSCIASGCFTLFAQMNAADFDNDQTGSEGLRWPLLDGAMRLVRCTSGIVGGLLSSGAETFNLFENINEVCILAIIKAIRNIRSCKMTTSRPAIDLETGSHVMYLWQALLYCN
jgi:hypothetical protein